MKKIAGVLALLAVWQVGSMMTTPLFVPSPMSVLDALVGLAETGQLIPGLTYSFSRITIAAIISMSVAVPLALLVCAFKPIKDEERAKTVKNYFVANGIDANRIIVVGNGNTKMVADPNGADAELNRRTDIFFKTIES